MITPRIEMTLEKIAHNARALVALYGSKGIDVIGVTKVVCGNPYIAKVLTKSGIRILADSRIENIKKMRNAGIEAQFLLLRTPSLSHCEAVVKYSDMSLNSELTIIEKLSAYAVEYDKSHKIILMLELGDLREGLMPADLDHTIEQILKMDGIMLTGIGANLACFGGVKPDAEKMNLLSSIAVDIEDKFGLQLEFVSGGNSANYDWFMSTSDVGRINNLRLGESIYLGCETLSRKPIPGLYTDAMTLVTEVIESKIKPSLPYGTIAQDAFGNITQFVDQGEIRRAILGIGLQDVNVSGLTPRIDVEILGASSDHIIVNAKDEELKVGDELEFDLNYAALLAVMTSRYVNKVSSDRVNAHEYCERVEQKYRRHVRRMQTTALKDNLSQLVSLNDSSFNLMFEPSIMENYQYMVREAVYDKIGRISKRLDMEDKTLWIRSAYRSFEHQRLLWEERVNSLKIEYPKKELEEIEELVSYFIAPPSKSMHATGGAVDALIYDLKHDSIMRFGTNDGYKIDLNDKCYPYHPYITPEAKVNRKLIIGLFEAEDFVVDIKEYWHFDYGNISWATEKGKEQAIYGIIEA
ncbi:MAG: alanine racemase [Candidatus Marinimicrobia bacterium]|nr:alanine racemase [Candidatus Neomarinimicrobiota bacterium]